MIKIFKNWLNNNARDQTDKNSLYNKIIFEVRDDDTIKVDLLFNDPKIDSPEKIGEFLYYLNNGYYTSNILDILVGLSRQKPEYKDFVRDIIHFWSLKITPESKISDTPLVPPTYFQQNTFNNKKT